MISFKDVQNNFPLFLIVSVTFLSVGIGFGVQVSERHFQPRSELKLELEVTSLEAEKSTLEDSIETTLEDLKATRAQLDALQRRYADAEKEVTKLSMELKKKQDQHDASERRNTDMEMKIVELTEQLSAKRAQLDTLKPTSKPGTSSPPVTWYDPEECKTCAILENFEPFDLQFKPLPTD